VILERYAKPSTIPEKKNKAALSDESTAFTKKNKLAAEKKLRKA